MEMGTVRGLITLVVFALFIGICWWAYSPHNKRRFEQDAKLPFEDEGEEAHRMASGREEAS